MEEEDYSPSPAKTKHLMFHHDSAIQNGFISICGDQIAFTLTKAPIGVFMVLTWMSPLVQHLHFDSSDLPRRGPGVCIVFEQPTWILIPPNSIKEVVHLYHDGFCSSTSRGYLYTTTFPSWRRKKQLHKQFLGRAYVYYNCVRLDCFHLPPISSASLYLPFPIFLFAFL